MSESISLTPTSAEPPAILLGRIGRAHGLRGEVSIDVRTDVPQQRFAVGVSVLSDRGPLTITQHRWQGNRLLLSFAGVRDRTAAEDLNGVSLWLAPPAAGEKEVELELDEFFDWELIDLEVCNAQGQSCGHIVEVLHLPAQDLLVIETAAGFQELLPFVAEFVPEIDVQAGRVVITPPAGLFSDRDLAD